VPRRARADRRRGRAARRPPHPAPLLSSPRRQPRTTGRAPARSPASLARRPASNPRPADSKASKSADPKPSKPDPKASKQPATADSKASKSELKQSATASPKASKSGTRQPATTDPKANKQPATPDPKASKQSATTDPKASKQPATADPKASKPDPKASKQSATTDPKASKPVPKPSKDAKPGKTEPKPDTKPSKDAKPGKTGPRPDLKPSKDAKPGDAPPPAAPAPVPPASLPVPAASDGYWLGAQLLGPADAQAAATTALAAGLASEPAAAGAIGRAASLPEAVQWVARWAFTGDPLPPVAREPADLPLHEGPAPRPGGALRSAHGVVLHSLTITGRSSDGGTRPIRWPQTSAEIVPPGLPWIPAVLLAERAPLFAAPAAHVPPASERHALVRRSGSLFVLGHLDRCTAATGERVCTRWAQVIARDGDSFRGGYVPAFQVARVDGWIRGAGQNPRAQLLIAGTRGSHAQFVLVARTRDGNLHRRTILAPMTGDSYPAARLRVDGEWATIDFTGSAQQRVALDPGMDARVR
jgi:hypothetical protein